MNLLDDAEGEVEEASILQGDLVLCGLRVPLEQRQHLRAAVQPLYNGPATLQ